MLFINKMIEYTKIHRLLRARMSQKGLSLRDMEEESGIDYGTLWRLLKAESNEEVFKEGKGRKGKVIMNITADTLDKLCKYLGKKPGELLAFKRK